MWLWRNPPTLPRRVMITAQTPRASIPGILQGLRWITQSMHTLTLSTSSVWPVLGVSHGVGQCPNKVAPASDLGELVRFCSGVYQFTQTITFSCETVMVIEQRGMLELENLNMCLGIVPLLLQIINSWLNKGWFERKKISNYILTVNLQYWLIWSTGWIWVSKAPPIIPPLLWSAAFPGFRI